MDAMADLIFVGDVRRSGEDPRALRDGVARGRFVRVRRGVYCTAERWAELDDRSRHLLAIHAVDSEVRGSALVAGRSAGTLWGFPFSARWPDPVRLLVPWRGGGASEPGVSRTAEGWASAIADEVGGVLVTTPVRTVVDIARFESVDRCVAMLDWAQSRKRSMPMPLEALEHELGRAGLRRGAAKVRRALAVSSDLSESIGESMARVAMLRLGFDEPELQHEFVDQDGSMFPDFFWPHASVAAEFDGKVKYTRDEYTGGDPSEVVWREKLREDRLRRQVRSVARIVWRDVFEPPRLAALLVAAGVPRSGRRRTGS